MSCASMGAAPGAQRRKIRRKRGLDRTRTPGDQITNRTLTRLAAARQAASAELVAVIPPSIPVFHSGLAAAVWIGELFIQTSFAIIVLRLRDLIYR